MRGKKWSNGKITRKVSPTCYEVLLNEGRLTKRHIDHTLRDNTAKDLESVLLSESTSIENVVPEDRHTQRKRYPQGIRQPVERYGMGPKN